MFEIVCFTFIQIRSRKALFLKIILYYRQYFTGYPSSIFRLKVYVHELQKFLIFKIWIEWKQNDVIKWHKKSIEEHVYIRSKVNSNRFEISSRFEKRFRLYGNFTSANLEIANPFQKLFHLHGDFTAATFQTILTF